MSRVLRNWSLTVILFVDGVIVIIGGAHCWVEKYTGK